MPGVVYIAPDELHLSIVRNNDGLLCCRLLNSEPINFFRPSATPLFHSLAQACPTTAAGLILTGMGDDGVDGLLAMQQADCLTFAQDESSSVVYGMPAAAIKAGAATKVLKLKQIAAYLETLVDNIAEQQKHRQTL